MSTPHVYLIAGEPSGDRLGADLIRALKDEAPGVRIAGIGGRGMRAQGLDPLFGIEQLSVMGLTEVLPRLPTLLRLLREATSDVLAAAPDVLVTIDAPSFTLRVAERVRRTNPAIRTVHYVAPSVWAWRPGRAAHMARFVDHVLALLPFEPALMADAGMSADFVGHPAAWEAGPTETDISAFRQACAVPAEAPLLLVAPGSRMSEIRRHGANMAAAARKLAVSHPDLRLLLPLAETTAEAAQAALAAADLPVHALPPGMEPTMRRAAFACARAGIVKSGTIGLETAAAGVPHVSVYRASFITAAIVRRLVRVDTAHIVNLVAGARIVPELFQEALTPTALADAVEPLLRTASAARLLQCSGFERAMAELGRGGEPPSRRAARSVLRRLE